MTPERPYAPRVMRKAAATVLVGIALASAVFFGTLRLGPHGIRPACTQVGMTVNLPDCATVDRAGWQYPVAVVIAGLGLLGAFGVLRRT
jgi:hypothetical protein